MSEVPLAARSTTDPLPSNEVERLEALHRYKILDTPPEESFDRITNLAARLFDVPIALVSLVDQFRAWFKSGYGFDSPEVRREDSICSFAILADDVFVVPDTKKDPRFISIPATLSEPGVRFYAGAPLITKDGFNLGTLCILDTKPHNDFSAEKIATLADLAATVVDQLELRLATRQIIQMNTALQEVTKGVSALIGEELFFSLVQHLAKALNVEHAYIAQLVEGSQSDVRTIALCIQGQIEENIQYSLANTPCEKVIEQRKLCCYPRQVQSQFPKSILFKKLEIESFVAVPFFDSTGSPRGILVVMDRKPLEHIALAESLLTIFATRIGAEIERRDIQVEQQKLVAVVENSSDFISIGTFDGEVLFVNDSGKKLVGLLDNEQVKQTKLSDFFSAKDIINFQENILPTIKESEQWEGELNFRHFQTGETIPVHYNFFAIKDSKTGQPIGVATVSQDIRDRLRVEAERTQLLAQEQAARAEAELERSYLHSLLSDAPASISITNGTKGSELVFEFANPLYHQLVGKQELIGKSIGELFPELEDQAIYELLDGVIATGEPFVGKEFFAKLDRLGNGIMDEGFFNFVYQPKYGLDGKIEGVMTFAFEVTDLVVARKQAEVLAEDLRQQQIALKQSEERYRALVVATSQAVWITNAEGLIIDEIPSWQNLTGQSFLEAKGWGWLDAVHPEDRERTAKAWTHALETKNLYEIEHRLRTANGEYRYFFVRGVPVVTEDGIIREWVGAHTDITTAKQIESERAELLAREQAARTQAESANRIKDEFLAVLSHELRSPLNPILGWTKLLRTRQFDKQKADKALETIERNALLQSRLIEDLLDISRIMQGKISLNPSQVNLITTIEAAIETVRLAAEAKSINLTFEIFDLQSPDVVENSVSIDSANPKSSGAIQKNSNFLISGDSSRLQQVVWNLLGNAIKFTPPSGCVEIELSLVETNEKSYAQIQVRDTGKGINAEFLPHVFEYFRQAEGSINRKYGGLGLGLAIARHLVEMHGGIIYAESDGEGKGATFTVQLPLTTVQKQKNEPSILVDNVLQLEDLRILVVDDEPDTRELHIFILEQYGAKVIGAASAAEAIQLINNVNLDILVSDLGMPNEDGFCLIRQVRALESPARNIPAIAVTAYARAEDSTKALEAGFQAHIAKPIDADKLVKAIATLSGQLIVDS